MNLSCLFPAIHAEILSIALALEELNIKPDVGSCGFFYIDL